MFQKPAAFKKNILRENYMVDQRFIKFGSCGTQPTILTKTKVMLDFSAEVLKILIY